MAKSKAAKAGKSLEEFRENHDKGYIIPKKIRDGLESLGESWVYEQEFVRLAGLSLTDFSRFRDPFMDDHCVEVRGIGTKGAKRIWCGTKAFRDQLAEMTDV